MRCSRPGLRIALLTALLSSAAGCGRDDHSPEAVAMGFYAAVARGNAERVLEFADRAAVERAQTAASQASDQVGGRRNIEAQEMLQVVDFDWTTQIVRAELVEHTADAARVELVAANDTRHELHLVREPEGWKVRIPIPPTEKR